MTRLTVGRIKVNGFGPLRNVDLDLSDLSGVVVLDGRNGSGKSTLLEHAILGSIYRKTSRGGLKESAEIKGATIEAELHNGSPITVRHSVSSTGKTTRQEAVWVNGSPTSGKVRDFDLAREADPAIPSYELMLASAFSRQDGFGSLADCSVAEKKERLAELLGLQKYQAYYGYAKDRCKQLHETTIRYEARLSDLQGGDVDAIVANLGDAERAKREDTEKLADIRRELEAARGAEARAKADLDAVEERLKAWQERFDRVERLRREHEEAVGALNSARVAKRQVADLALSLVEVERIAGELQELAPRITEATADRERVLEEGKGHSKLIEQTESDIARYRDVLERADRIRAAAGEVESQSGALSEAEEEVRQADQECEANRGRVQDHRAAEAEVERVEEKIRVAERGCSNLDQVPLGDDCINSGCPFIADAVECKGTLEGLREHLTTTRERLDPGSATDLTSSEARLRAARDRVVSASRDLEAARASAQDLPLLREAESRSEDLKARMEKLKAERENMRCDYRSFSDDCMELERQKVALTAELAKHAPEGEQRLRDAKATAEADANREQELQAKVDAFAEALTQVENGVGEKPSEEGARKALREAEESVRGLSLLEQDYQARVSTLDRQIASYEAERKQAQEAGEKRLQLQEELERTHQDLARWKIVEHTFSRKGLQALLLDAAGPRISELCNQLLDMCMSHFRVKLVTTRLDSTGKKQVEDLDLMVFDGLKGTERSISALSGGEGVLVTLALRLAVVLHGGAGSACDFLCLDEMDGALDSENASAFVPLIRQAMQMGNLRLVLLVSHRDAVKAQADHVLTFQPQVDGTSTVRMEERT